VKLNRTNKTRTFKVKKDKNEQTRRYANYVATKI